MSDWERRYKVVLEQNKFAIEVNNQLIEDGVGKNVMKLLFKDRYNLVHDKATDGFNASSGNPGIYTAVYVLVAYDKEDHVPDYSKVFTFEIKQFDAVDSKYYYIRHPDRPDIASLDEIIGWIALGYITAEDLMQDNWRWYDQVYTVPWYRVLQAIIFVTGKHRNAFKIHHVRDIHQVAYWIPYHIQYFALRKSGYPLTKFNKLSLRIIALAPFFYLWLLSVFLKRSYIKGEYQRQSGSQKQIAWVVLKSMNHPLHKLINYKKTYNRLL